MYLVVAGGIIPQADHNMLRRQGVSGIFGPGTVVAEAARNIVAKLLKTVED